MTIIASIPCNGAKVLIGDILLSGKGMTYPADTIMLPTGFTNVEQVTVDGWSPSGLMQKVVLLHKRLALAWSGSTQHIHEFIVRLRACLRFRGVSLAIIVEFANEMQPILSDLQVIFHVQDLDGQCWVLPGPGVEKMHVNGLGNIYLAGSGTDLLKEAVKRMVHPAELVALRWSAVSLALNLIAALYDVEVIHQSTTPEGVGGGYEVCHNEGQGFVKLDNLVLAKFHLDLDETGYETAAPIAYLAARYDGRDLVMCSLLHETNSALPFGTYARSPGFGRWHRPQPHDSFLSGNNYATSARLSWRGEFISDLYNIQTNISDDEDRPIILNPVISERGNELAFHHPSKWVIEQVKLAKTVITERYPDAQFSGS